MRVGGQIYETRVVQSSEWLGPSRLCLSNESRGFSKSNSLASPVQTCTDMLRFGIHVNSETLGPAIGDCFEFFSPF